MLVHDYDAKHPSSDLIFLDGNFSQHMKKTGVVGAEPDRGDLGHKIGIWDHSTYSSASNHGRPGLLFGRIPILSGYSEV